MAVIKVLDNATTDGVGLTVTNGDSMAVYGITLNGFLGKAFVDVLIDLGGGGWVVAGSLSPTRPAQLILLPAGAKLNARLVGCSPDTSVTVKVSS